MNTMDERELTLRRIKNSSPVFIIGCQRSGTSFLFRLINRYLSIGFGRDNGHFIRLKKMLPYYGNLDNRDNLVRLIKDIHGIPEFAKRFNGLEINIDDFIENLEEYTYPEIVRRYYAEWAMYKGTMRWGGKTPDYTFHSEELYDLFPDGKYLHIYRDGRDVALSLFRQNWGPQNAFVAAGYWEKRVQAGRKFGAKLSKSSFMEMRYEDLLGNPELEFVRILDFIEYDVDREGLLRHFRTDIDDFFMRNNYDKWKTKMSGIEKRAFEMSAGRLLKDLNYEVLYPDVFATPPSAWTRFYYILDNLARKLIRGQGFRGFYNKTYFFLSENFSKVKYKIRGILQL